jgi:hypothetical protein
MYVSRRNENTSAKNIPALVQCFLVPTNNQEQHMLVHHRNSISPGIFVLLKPTVQSRNHFNNNNITMILFVTDGLLKATIVITFDDAYTSFH